MRLASDVSDCEVALLRRGDSRFAICTTTLAEGVNLPIRTLVLYSVQRRGKGGLPENLLARDIKNLVGRAGRAGASTKGLVICANADQWQVIEPVARLVPGEPVTGALRRLVARLQRALALQNVTLTNAVLENEPTLHTLIDGVDSTLIDLATEEIVEEDLVRLAIALADETFASRQATLQTSKRLLQRVFELRARRVIGIRTAGRLAWIKETGARARMLDSVETGLLPRREAWDDVTNPVDPAVVSNILDWAWMQPDLQAAVREKYRLADGADADTLRVPFGTLVSTWLSGSPFVEVAARTNLPIDDLLGIHTHAVMFVLQTLIEQAVALLDRLLQSQGRTMASAVGQFPEHLRFGVPTAGARALAARGLRHRRAAVGLGQALEGRTVTEDRATLFGMARQLLNDQPEDWQRRLGILVYERTLQDLI